MRRGLSKKKEERLVNPPALCVRLLLKFLSQGYFIKRYSLNEARFDKLFNAFTISKGYEELFSFDHRRIR